MILVTGASGLVGSHLLCELTQEAPIVRALYRSENRKQDTKEIFNFFESTIATANDAPSS